MDGREIKEVRLELRAERAVVEKTLTDAGYVEFRRELRRRHETFTVELASEVLVIEVAAVNGARVLLDGQVLPPGRHEIELSSERAEVVRHAQQQPVRVSRRRAVHRETVRLELAHEELDVCGEP